MLALLKAKGYYKFIAPATAEAAAKADADTEQKAQGFIMTWVETRLHSIVPDNATALQTWNLLCERFEKANFQVKATCLHNIQHVRYADDGNLDEHLARRRDNYAQLDAMGAKMEDDIRVIFLLGSLPPSWDHFVTSYTAAATAAASKLTVETTCAAIQQERDRRVLAQQRTTALIEPATATAYAAVQRPATPRRRRDVTCAWCLKPGHEEHECYGKAAGRPRVHRDSRAHIASAAPGPTQHYLYTAFSPSASADLGVWYMDSGASNHYCGESSLMTSLTKCPLPDVTSANGGRTPVTGIGSVTMFRPLGPSTADPARM